MPLIRTARWVNPPGISTELYEGKATLAQLVSHKIFSPTHELDLGIYKTLLFENCRPSSKLFPLIVALWETNEVKKYNDFYSFDNNGVLLSHGYSRWEYKKPAVEEQHDLSLDRLVEHGKTISEMIDEYPVPTGLAMHTTLIDLRNNTLVPKKS